MALTRITKGVIKPNENYDTHDINSTGIITATALNISGNASIGGVLTYEDVTSIDSVGIITAQNGLHVLNGYVGIGTAFPGEALDINSKTNSRAIRVYSEGLSSTSKLVLRTGDSGTCKIHFGDTSDIDTGEIRYRNNGDIMSFHVDANSERLTLNSDRFIIGENLSNNQPTYNSSTTLVTTHTNNPGAWNAIAIVSGNTTGASFLKFGDRDSESVSQIGHYNSDNSLRFYTNGSVNERLRIDSDGRSLFTRGGLTASRNVGTKTGEIQVANSSNSSAITIINYANDVSGPHLMFGKTRAGNATGSTVLQSGDRLGEIAFCGADGTDIDSFGAAIKSHVDGTPGANDMPGRLEFYTTGDGGSSAVERLRLDSDGLLGLNVTPSYSGLFGGSQKGMHIGGTTAPFLRITSSTSGQGDLILQAGNSGADVQMGNLTEAGDIVFWNKPSGGSLTERLRIYDGGKLHLKNTITSSVQSHFEIGNGQGSFDFEMSDATGGSDFIRHVKNRFVGKNTYGLTITSRSTLSGSYTKAGEASIKFYYPSAGGGAQAGGQLEFWTNQNGYAGTTEAKRMQISNTGNIGAPNGNNIYNASDERLKENMVELTNGLDKIKKLKPISFNWKDGWDECMSGKKEYGFGAQTTQVVDEMLVEPFGTEDALLNGETIENPLRVNEKYIIPLLVKAIQEQQEQIETLKTEVDALKSS